jgi:hypothetical protein
MRKKPGLVSGAFAGEVYNINKGTVMARLGDTLSSVSKDEAYFWS